MPEKFRYLSLKVGDGKFVRNILVRIWFRKFLRWKGRSKMHISGPDKPSKWAMSENIRWAPNWSKFVFQSALNSKKVALSTHSERTAICGSSPPSIALFWKSLGNSSYYLSKPLLQSRYFRSKPNWVWELPFQKEVELIFQILLGTWRWVLKKIHWRKLCHTLLPQLWQALSCQCQVAPPSVPLSTAAGSPTSTKVINDSKLNITRIPSRGAERMYISQIKHKLRHYCSKGIINIQTKKISFGVYIRV